MRPHLPSISTLIAFESAGRQVSFSRAALDLHLTQSAVSRRIAQLEKHLGVRLFERVRRGIVLTDPGLLYLADVQRVLSELTQATQRAMSFVAAPRLNLAVLPTFSTRWLLPRLPEFFSNYPDIMVNFTARIVPFDFNVENFDAAIHFGEPNWPGAICKRLMDEDLVPVASRTFRNLHRITRLADLDNVVLLQQSTRPTTWSEWLQSAGVPTRNALRGPCFEQFSMIAEAAANNLGVGLLPRFFVEDELSSGRLEVLFEHKMHCNGAYYIVYPEEKASSTVVLAFADWICMAAQGRV